jgi:hypothetical protein
VGDLERSSWMTGWVKRTQRAEGRIRGRCRLDGVWDMHFGGSIWGWYGFLWDFLFFMDAHISFVYVVWS